MKHVIDLRLTCPDKYLPRRRFSMSQVDFGNGIILVAYDSVVCDDDISRPMGMAKQVPAFAVCRPRCRYLSLYEEKKLSQLKILLAEAGDDIMIAGSYMFLAIAFFAAMAVPKAALLPLVLAMGCYLLARKNEAS